MSREEWNVEEIEDYASGEAEDYEYQDEPDHQEAEEEGGGYPDEEDEEKNDPDRSDIEEDDNDMVGGEDPFSTEVAEEEEGDGYPRYEPSRVTTGKDTVKRTSSSSSRKIDRLQKKYEATERMNETVEEKFEKALRKAFNEYDLDSHGIRQNKIEEIKNTVLRRITELGGHPEYKNPTAVLFAYLYLTGSGSLEDLNEIIKANGTAVGLDAFGILRYARYITEVLELRF